MIGYVCMLGISIMPLSMIFIGYWNCSASTTRYQYNHDYYLQTLKNKLTNLVCLVRLWILVEVDSTNRDDKMI